MQHELHERLGHSHLESLRLYWDAIWKPGWAERPTSQVARSHGGKLALILVPLHVGLSLGPIQCPCSRGDISRGQQSTDHDRKCNASSDLASEVMHSHCHLLYCSHESGGEQTREGVDTRRQGSLGAIVAIGCHTVATVYCLESTPLRWETIHATSYLYAFLQYLEPS